MLRQNYKSNRKISTGFIVSCILIAISIFIIVNKQSIVDQITFWRYKPTVEIESLVGRAGMNDNGKFMFFASQPKLDATNDFNKECDRIENDTSILGCYSNSRIYIYDVKDKQLDGIREVTAVHETLHAIYARIGNGEKSKVDALIEIEYQKLKDNKDFADLMDFYDRTEPGQRNNELHSLIGTEVSIINPELENYYRKYFSNRQSTVNLNQQYSAVFKSLKNRADELAKEYNALSLKIKTDTDVYNADADKLSSDIKLFNSRATNGYFTSQWQFNQDRLTLINRSSSLEVARSSIQDDISMYDSMLVEYNSIASESKKLYNIIDSTLAPAPSI